MFIVRAIQDWNKLNVNLKRSLSTKQRITLSINLKEKSNLLLNHFLVSSSFTFFLLL